MCKMGSLGLEYHPSAPISYPSLQEIGLKKYFPWVQEGLLTAVLFLYLQLHQEADKLEFITSVH